MNSEVSNYIVCGDCHTSFWGDDLAHACTRCKNCEGIDPGSCLFNPYRVPSPTQVPVPSCPNCGPAEIESHPYKCVVRCANCKEWLAW